MKSANSATRSLTQFFLVLTLAFAVHCGRGRIFSGEAKCDADPCNCAKECTNVIDKSVRDESKCRLVPLTDAGDAELCRRLFVDTIGRLPTPEDFESHCKGKSLDAIVDDVMAMPDYVVARQRLWADRFGFNDQRTWYASTVALDLLVARLYKGEIDLPTFAVQAAIHPALLTAADELLVTQVARTANPTIDPRTLNKTSVDGAVETLFQALVLRSPSVDELSEFANMYRLYEVDPVAADANLPGYTARRVRVQPCNCAGAKKAFCQTSNLLGPPQDVSIPLRFPAVADCAAEPGNSFYVEDARPEELNTISAPGRLLVARPDFYEQHVREALVRLLGYDPLPLLAEADQKTLLVGLTNALATDGSLKNLEATIFRSVLYRQSQTPASPALDCNGKDSQLFAGPRKALDADAYFASIAALTGANLGKCDYRFQTRTYPKTVDGVTITAFSPPNSIATYARHDGQTADVVADCRYPGAPDDAKCFGEPDLSGRDKARTIGACVDRATIQKQDDTGPFFTMALDAITREACGAGDKVLPAGSSGTDEAALQAIVDHQYDRFFLGKASTEEKAASVTAMQACLQSTNTCPAALVGRRYCSALLKSARFSTY